MHSNRQSQQPDHAVLGQKANGCVATHTQPQRTWSKALSEEGFLKKKTRNNPKVVCRFCCRFDKRFRSDQASQSRLQSRKSLKSDPSVTIIRKAWINDPGRLYSGHRVFLKRQSPVSLDVPFDDAVRAIHADPQNKPRMSQNHNSLAYLLNRWSRWSLS